MAAETATLGGGCFWCIEAAFQRLNGVESVVSGYAGGALPDQDYRRVCTGTTGPAEVVQVRFDPEVIDFDTSLDVFFTIHDSTTLDRQGADVGTQYRSVIFCHDAHQHQVAAAKIVALDAAGVWDAPIVTQVLPLPTFYPAESYHQNYYRENPYQGYCQAVVAPKMTKLRQRHSALLRD
jgi:peptide-methionine (S)-S-oxide reductase